VVDNGKDKEAIEVSQYFCGGLYWNIICKVPMMCNDWLSYNIWNSVNK